MTMGHEGKLLEGRVALVTGGMKGIGLAISEDLAAHGADVAACGRGLDAADEFRAAVQQHGRRALALQADVSDFERAAAVVQEVLTELGRFDILVLNAGLNRDGVIWKMEEAQWDAVLGADLKGTFNYTRAAAPVFREQKSGRIIVISSINGLRGKFGQSNYSAAKAGTIGFAKAVAKELGRSGVTANVVCPGMIRTAMADNIPEKFIKIAEDETAVGRIGDPEDVAGLVTFLASDRARHITGEVIKVDGGQYI
jgi:3-oxoacyl-[acyl-carrier protein] reductase